MSALKKITIALIIGVVLFILPSCENSDDSGRSLKMESTLTINSDGSLSDDTLTISDTTTVRETGTPETIIYTFTSEAGEGIIQLTNGGLHEPYGEKVSSASIVFNGEVLFDTADFNQNVSTLQESVTLLSGDNVLLVTLQSIPGAKVTIRVLR